MAEGREVELKLELDPADADALRAHPLLAGAEPAARAQSSTYFDTPGQALRKAGYSLRVRRANGGFVQTVKRATSGAGLFDRPEWEAGIADGRPDLEALAATPLAGLIGPKRIRGLVPMVVTEVDRTIWHLDHCGSALEVALDTGTVRGGGEERPLSEAEIELKHGAPDGLLDFACRLAEHLPLRLGVLSKAERGFALAEGRLGKVTKAAALDLDPGMDVAEGFAAIVAACLRHFRLNEGLVASDRDPEALHQARVAMRRLRSAFSLFRPVLAGEEHARLRKQLRWFTGTLGDARNLDVFLAREGESFAFDRAALVAARERAYDAVVEALDSRRSRILMIELVAWTAAGEWRGRRRAGKPLPEFASARLDRLWRRIVDRGGDLAALGEKKRHRLRIEVKKLRYGVEFFAGLYPEAAPARKRFAAALENMQESLGHLNDIAIARELIDRLCLVPAIGAETLTPDPKEEAAHLAEAQAQFDLLEEAGPFWI